MTITFHASPYKYFVYLFRLNFLGRKSERLLFQLKRTNMQLYIYKKKSKLNRYELHGQQKREVQTLRTHRQHMVDSAAILSNCQNLRTIMSESSGDCTDPLNLQR